MRTERHKLIHFYNLDEWELYDLEKDPNELKSAYGDPDYKTITDELKTELERLRKHYGVPEDTRPVTRPKRQGRRRNQQAN